MNRLLLILLSQLAISTSLIVTTNVHAANDLERWNSEVGRTVRQSHSDKLAQTTYKEISSKNVKVAQDMRTVYPQIETQAQVAGSRTRVVAEAVLEVDKDKVWKDWAKTVGKVGRGANAVGGALAIGGLIVEAVGWVIDEGGKVTRHPTPEEINPSSYSYGYARPGWSSPKPLECYSLSSCQAYAETNAASWGNGWKLNGSCTINSSATNITCPLKAITGSSTNQVQFGRYSNPQYNPSSPPPENVEVTEAEKERVLKELLNDPKYADLAAQMIGNTYSMGPDNPEPDPNVVNDLKNKQKDVLKSDNPKGDGKTRTDPKIDTGTQGQADTTPKPDPNPDPGTTPTPNPNPNTGSTTNFELPAFCNYAAIVCDWIGWTKEEPELEEDSELEIEEQELIDYEYSDHIKFDASCPFKPRQEIFPLGALGDMRVEVDFSYFCEIATMMKSFVVALSGFIAVLMLAYAAKDI